MSHTHGCVLNKMIVRYETPRYRRKETDSCDALWSQLVGGLLLTTWAWSTDVATKGGFELMPPGSKIMLAALPVNRVG